MEELSVEEKAKAYDEAFERARNEYQTHTSFKGFCAKLVRIFPRLKENENEEIRKAIIDHFANAHSSMYPYKGFTKEQILAWLKKQSEQKPTDQAKPLEIGDLITNGTRIGKVDEIHEWGCHACFGDCYADVTDLENWHKWTIRDAKDGDVLTSKDGNILLLFRRIGNKHWDDVIDYHCYYDCNQKKFVVQKDANYWGNVDDNTLEPATKKQRELLFQKVKEADYEWDTEKKGLKRLSKSLPQPQQEWSEEDERVYKSITYSFAHNDPLTVQQQEFVKSLKERRTLKPTGAQLASLEIACDRNDRIGFDLTELFKKLKKLV